MQLYHNALSSCSQKVRMVLAEKGLAFDSSLIDLQKGEQFDGEYTKLNPNAVVPTLIDNGKAIIESTLINEYLDDAYPEISLKPDTAYERHQMRLFCKKIDDRLHPACGIATYSIAIRPGLLARPKEEVDAMVAKIPSEMRRAARRAVIEQGVAAPQFKQAMLTHRSMFDLADNMLADNEWLTGPTFSLADCALMPYVVRIDHLGQDHEINSRPNLARWYKAIQARSSFNHAVTEWAPAAAIAMFRQAGEAVRPDVAGVMNT